MNLRDFDAAAKLRQEMGIVDRVVEADETMNGATRDTVYDFLDSVENFLNQIGG